MEKPTPKDGHLEGRAGENSPKKSRAEYLAEQKAELSQHSAE
jgi:hypothetical protein